MTASAGVCADFDGGCDGGKYGVGFSAARGGVVKINHIRTSFCWALACRLRVFSRQSAKNYFCWKQTFAVTEP